MNLPKISKIAGLGTAAVLLSAGIASAAVATASVNVRTGPGTSYRVVDTLRAGDQVDVVGRSGGWCEVEKSGPDGWVSCNYLTENRVRDRYDDRYYRDGRPNVRFGINVGPDVRRAPPPRWRGWDDRRPESGFWLNGPLGGFGWSVRP